MLLWEDRDEETSYGYANKILMFSVQLHEGSSLPWRLSSNLPGMPVLLGQEKHVARGDAKAFAGKMMDNFLKSTGMMWKPHEGESRPSWAGAQGEENREVQAASMHTGRTASRC
ncbi:hypothetical protein [Streptomyces sp. 5-10]|uniref:hypothetical protein n=1 Tax=Streptomyces sp. 5-10 TaxID=878925 RepID=UPI00168A4E7C|nr:hypothetical protein [Streptomyces sp. 5-10]MBD3004748.1 hypothetical protein [Streptomyces sp. 5-10]